MYVCVCVRAIKQRGVNSSDEIEYLKIIITRSNNRRDQRGVGWRILLIDRLPMKNNVQWTVTKIRADNNRGFC